MESTNLTACPGGESRRASRRSPGVRYKVGKKSATELNPMLLAALFGRGLDSEQRAFVFRCQYIQQTVRTLPHIPNTLLQVAQHRFAVQFFPFLVEIDSFQ